jgi:hypothetical protein
MRSSNSRPAAGSREKAVRAAAVTTPRVAREHRGRPYNCVFAIFNRDADAERRGHWKSVAGLAVRWALVPDRGRRAAVPTKTHSAETL